MRCGGAKGSRTPDLLHAMQALSQLSYGPILKRATTPTRVCLGNRKLQFKSNVAQISYRRLVLQHRRFHPKIHRRHRHLLEDHRRP